MVALIWPWFVLTGLVIFLNIRHRRRRAQLTPEQRGEEDAELDYQSSQW